MVTHATLFVTIFAPCNANSLFMLVRIENEQFNAIFILSAGRINDFFEIIAQFDFIGGINSARYISWNHIGTKDISKFVQMLL